MNGFLNMDSKFMVAFNKFGDLFWLNMITLIFCIPIITIGPAITAMNCVALKIYRGEETYISKNFWKSFKTNFKQGMILGIIYTIAGAILIYDLILIFMGVLKFGIVFNVMIFIAGILYLISYTWVFVMLGRYYNPMRQTIKNSFLIGVGRMIHTIAMIIINLIPIVAIIFLPQILPLTICVGLAFPAFINAMMYSSILDSIEGTTSADREVVDNGWNVSLEEEGEEIAENAEAEEENSENAEVEEEIVDSSADTFEE